MTIDAARIATEGFYLYAETYLPDATARGETLAALQSCADGTGADYPSVATYVFRPSPLAQMMADRLFPGSLALESTELYLTHHGFRGHILTDQFRAGLRAMYKGTRRLGARIFWIGARPASDMLHNIYRSDPQARPIATLRCDLFDAARHAAAPVEDVAILSLALAVPPGQGAVAIDAVDALAESVRAISFVAFFHPLDEMVLRVFFVAAIDDAAGITAAVAPLAALAPVTGHAQVHRDRADLAATLQAALADVGQWQVAHDGYSGYPLHPAVSTDDTAA